MPELEAFAVAGGIQADPIPMSRAGIRVDKVSKLGHVAVASCRHCLDGLIIVEVGRSWVHATTKTASCLESRVRTGPTHPNDAHPLVRDPKTLAWTCPACDREEQADA